MTLTIHRSEAPRPPLLRRRAVLCGTHMVGTFALTGTQAACSTGSSNGRTTAAGRMSGSSPGSDPAASPTTQSGAVAPATPRVLLAYFSRAGENYYSGDRIDLKVGNTEVLARTISDQLRSAGVEHDVHRIQAADPYTKDYEDTVARNVREQDADARPGIARALDSIDAYGVVLLGNPIWNVRPPMIMHTFAESLDFTGKSVHPFTTHTMSGLGTAERDYATACRGASIGVGLAVQGEEVRSDGPPAVSDWLASISLT